MKGCHFALAALLLLLPVSTIPCLAAPTGVVLPANYLYKKGNVRCGYIGRAWEAGQLKSGAFISFKALIADLKKSLKRASAKNKRTIARQISETERKRSVQNKQVCSKRKRPAAPTPTPTPTATVEPFSDLTKLPSTSRLVQASAEQAGIYAVSGQPPALIDIPGMDIKPLYWQPGIIEGITAGTANASQCHDFWFGDQDGESGGMNGCNMTGQMGYTFSPIMLAGVSLCQLKVLPNPQLFQSGAIQPDGPLPASFDPAAMFKPASQSKLLRIHVTGTHPALLFVRIASQSENIASSRQYHADIWQCGNQSNEAVLRHSITVSADNQYEYGFYSHEQSFSSGGHQFTVGASLAQDSDGSTRFDLTKNRHAAVEHLDADGVFGFRQDITISPENLLKIKSRWQFPYGWRTDYSVSRFSGTGIRDLRLREGAIKAIDHNNGEPAFESLNGIEFRDDRYAAAPAATLVTEASGINFLTDTFFATAPSVAIDTSTYLCNLQPEAAVTVNGDHPAIAALFSDCSQYTIWQTNFCALDQQVTQAQQNWGGYCPAVMAAG